MPTKSIHAQLLATEDGARSLAVYEQRDDGGRVLLHAGGPFVDQWEAHDAAIEQAARFERAYGRPSYICDYAHAPVVELARVAFERASRKARSRD